jgi:phosphate transport system substrate-binding protein
MVLMQVITTGCKQKKSEETISISGAFALYPLTVKWAEEYQKINPKITIDISAGGAGKGMTDVLSGMVDLAMFSRSVSPEEVSKGAWFVSVSRDAVLPTVSARNPHLADLLRLGVSREEFTSMWVDKKITEWNQLTATPGHDRMNVFTRSDACGAAEMWGKYLGSNQEGLQGVGVFGDPGISDAVKNDPFAIGYNNVIYAYDINTRKPYDGIRVLPIDINNNGKIDADEDFYESLDSVMISLQDGRYPAPPARDLYLISKGAPAKKAVRNFLVWILQDGQKYVSEAGYAQLKPEQIAGELAKLK